MYGDPFRGYDQWLTTDPFGDYEPLMPGDPDWPRCSNCGAWLKLEPNFTEGKETTETCDGKWSGGIAWSYPPICGNETEHSPHEFVDQAWGELHRICKKCGHDNIEIEL